MNLRVSSEWYSVDERYHHVGNSLFYHINLIKETAKFDMTNKGYTRGGSRITGVNYFLSSVVVSVFLLADYDCRCLHVIFQGVPTMATLVSSNERH